ncbi:phage tailspike protein [Serratia marcescens]
MIPPRLLTLVSSFKGSANGQMYIGRADTDPLVSANQIPVYLEREDGSRMLVSQPILLDESSAPRINSEGGRLVTLESYALAVHDREGGSSFIFPMSVNMSLILLTYILMGSCQSYLPLLGPILLGIKMSP